MRITLTLCATVVFRKKPVVSVPVEKLVPLCNLKVHYHNSLQRRAENVPKNLVIKPEGKRQLERWCQMKDCMVLSHVEGIGYGNVD